MADKTNKDSFEINVGRAGLQLKAQGAVPALVSAVLSIGALATAAYFGREALLPLLVQRRQEAMTRSVEDGEEEEVRRGIPLAVSAGVSIGALVASVYFGRRAWVHFLGKVKVD